MPFPVQPAVAVKVIETPAQVVIVPPPEAAGLEVNNNDCAAHPFSTNPPQRPIIKETKTA